MTEFYNRHLCRVVPFPDFVQRSFAKLDQYPEVYLTMNGPSEFYVVGTLKNWDVRAQLGQINAPTLITSGKYDEATPVIMDSVHTGIRGSQWVLFENSAHLAHAEEPERYMQILGDFIHLHEP